MAPGRTLEQALPGRNNAKDWLTLKMVECFSEPMSEKVAERLAAFSGAYDALEKWAEDEKPAERADSSGAFTMREANAWAEKMQNADGTTGPHWSLEQTKIVQAERKIGGSPAVFYAALNATYSDLCLFFKKYGLNSIEPYVDFVRAFWLEDQDAKKNKVQAYYENVVK